MLMMFLLMLLLKMEVLTPRLKQKIRLNIVFTSLHGTSITIIPETLNRAGYKNVHIVKEQREVPDGDFPNSRLTKS